MKSIRDCESRILVLHIVQSIQDRVNNEEDIDIGWILEIAIRFEDYPELSKEKYSSLDICEEWTSTVWRQRMEHLYSASKIRQRHRNRKYTFWKIFKNSFQH